MRTLYVSRQGCTIRLSKTYCLEIQHRQQTLDRIQLPHLEQIAIFGRSEITTPALRACLERDIPIAHLSRSGYCYGRTTPIARGMRHLARQQQQLSDNDRLEIAKAIVRAKLHNSRIFLQRQNRRHPDPQLQLAIDSLAYLHDKAENSTTTASLMGIEGAGASHYFSSFGQCLRQPGFQFGGRHKRPPTNPANALLSFGYALLWNHILSQIELHGLDPYQACLHSGSDRHPALASDLIEEFRTPIIESIITRLVNNRAIDPDLHFEYRDGGCFLNSDGRRRFISSFIRHMDEPQGDHDPQPRWDRIVAQVKALRDRIADNARAYVPYRIR
jgi:CRISPR-associated protein Cas1